MPRIQPVNPAQVQGKTKDLLEAARKALGGTPNLITTLAQSPAALEGYLGFAGALAAGQFRVGLREQVALAVAGVNSCEYCASAHTAIGSGAGVSKEELARALDGEPSDPKAAAAVRLARLITEKRGLLSDADIQAARQSGLDDGQIVEIVAHTALSIFTNYLNHVAQTVVDFPRVEVRQHATA
ncbi:MAG: carboxymuconolactone decarboxylase family protein [Phycisphaerales bacterium]|nr:carboxymuconolactone decarboxylase family protein [Phycisphaerales bacterium]